MVSCQKGPTRHACEWQIGPFWQDIIDMWGHLNTWYLCRLLIIFCLFTSYITHKPPTWACYWSLESITIHHSLPGYNHTLGQDHTSSYINSWDKTCISVGRSMKALGPHSHSSQSYLHIEAEKKMTFILQISFQNHFLKWNVLYFDSNFTKFDPNRSINNKAVLIKIMAQWQTSDRLLSETMILEFTGVNMGQFASLS